MTRAIPPISAIGAVLLAGLSLALAQTAAAQGPTPFSPAPRHGVLLLRNGETIDGNITRTGDHYLVAVPNGEIRVRAVDVDFACDSLQEGYERKKSLIRLGTVQEHLQLAEWCQRHGLREFAERELAEAEATEPRHPMIGVLRRRLDVATTPAVQPQLDATAVNTETTVEELDRLVRGLPHGSVETFTQTIQPLLVNNCTTSGCHGGQEGGKFQLMKTPSSRPAGRRTTQRNLQATLECVDRANPEASPLLLVPIRPHGPLKTPIFTTAEAEQYARLVGWVQQLASRTAAAPARVETPKPNLSQAMATPAARMMAENAIYKDEPPSSAATAPDGSTPEATDAVVPASVDLPFAEGPAEGPHLKRGNPLPGFVPVDPFDPEIFNRRFSPSAPATPGSPVAP